MTAAPPPRSRVLDQEGRSLVVRLGPRRRVFGDFYHALLRASWTQLMAIIVVGFVAANAAFATLYLLGDGVEGARPGNFADAFFFSVQTMATIGYGKMGPRTPLAHVVVTVEAFCGLIGFATATGLVFSKFARPTARVLFSQVAVVTTWEGMPALMFRMANERSNQIVEATCNLAIVRDEVTRDGMMLRRVRDLPLLRNRSPVFTLTWSAIHVITADSPLAGATTESLADSEAMLIVTFTGIDETFSQTVYARHAYTAADVVFGARFADVFGRLPDGTRTIDLRRFHEVETGTGS